jgi:hypothetical protein
MTKLKALALLAAFAALGCDVPPDAPAGTRSAPVEPGSASPAPAPAADIPAGAVNELTV